MPIHDSDWSLQFFEGVPCPEDVHIAASDPEAWAFNPRHNWVYDKLAVAASQGIRAAPHGVVPSAFPVFSKPITNLYGMGAESRVIADAAAYDRSYRPGHMWMELLAGEHVSSDVAVLDGQPVWWRHATGVPAGSGMFDYWTIHAEPFAAIEDYCGRWIGHHLAGYSGMVNLETIGARIIELHLRFTDQWPDIYGGRAWVEALVGLYAAGRWSFADRDRRTGYSVALFGPPADGYRHPRPALTAELLALPGVTSLQATFHEGLAADGHSNPPGGFRLAVLNGYDLPTLFDIRRRLAAFHGLARPLNDTAAAPLTLPLPIA
ncbi:MAG: hypothetical protein R3D33_07895 [Hyphomicrobiaceae bacterium]